MGVNTFLNKLFAYIELFREETTNVRKNLQQIIIYDERFDNQLYTKSTQQRTGIKNLKKKIGVRMIHAIKSFSLFDIETYSKIIVERKTHP